jgi:Bacterial dnaA protein helix-turn-helix
MRTDQNEPARFPRPILDGEGFLKAIAASSASPLQDRALVAGRFVAALVGWATGIGEDELLASGRGPGETARARQIAMYLLHTSLSASYGEVARAFGRDRTTVSHACRLIEDTRDDPRHDALLCRLETVLAVVAPLFALGQEG